MAKGVQIPIEVVDKFSRQLADMEKKLGDISGAAEKQNNVFGALGRQIAGALTVGAVVAFGASAVRSFGESEMAASRLQVSMKNLGVFTEAALERQLRFSDALQATTAFSDEQVTGIQTQLTSFGLYGKELEKVTKLTLDLAAGQKIDASQAAMLLGKAYVGQTGTLSKLGITFDETGSQAQRFASIQEGLQRRFGGSAAAELTTYEGKVKNLANAYDNIKEKIGGDLVRSSDQAMVALSKLASFIDKNYESVKRVAAFSANLGGGGAIIAMAKDWNGSAEAAERAYEAGNKAMAAVKEKQNKPAAPVDADAEAARLKRLQEIDDAEWTAAETGRIKAEGFLMTSEQLKNQDAENAAAELERFGNTEAAKRVLSARTVEIERGLNASRIANIQSTLSFISTLQHAKSKELVAIGKAAAIIDTTIHTAVAVMGAYRAFSWIPAVGPALGAAAAAIVATAGAAQVAMISGLQLREGAFVPGSAAGVQATIGEAGRDEAVIPLESGVAMRRIGRAIADAGGSGGGSAGGVNVVFGDIIVHGVPGDASDRRDIVDEFVEQLRAGAAKAIDFAVLSSQLAARHPLRTV